MSIDASQIMLTATHLFYIVARRVYMLYVVYSCTWADCKFVFICFYSFYQMKGSAKDKPLSKAPKPLLYPIGL